MGERQEKGALKYLSVNFSFPREAVSHAVTGVEAWRMRGSVQDTLAVLKQELRAYMATSCKDSTSMGLMLAVRPTQGQILMCCWCSKVR